mgnify:CR=1 FL=1
MDTHSIIKQLTEQLSNSPGHPGFFVCGMMGRFNLTMKKVSLLLLFIFSFGFGTVTADMDALFQENPKLTLFP